jgi:hypothetical protein
MTPATSLLWRAAVLVTLATAPTTFARADAQEDTALNKIVALNKKAVAAYEALDVDSAASLLNQALRLCKSAHLDQHSATARTHLHLGVVYIGGLKYPELGLAEFREALAIDPHIQIPKSLLNPDVQAALDQARFAQETPAARTNRAPFPTGQEPPVSPTSNATQALARIGHPPVTRAARGQAIEIKAHVPPGLGAAKVVLAYLAQNGDDFLARAMTPAGNATGWFHEHIPAEATHGDWVSYYIEAQDDDERVMAKSGTPEDPHQIILAAEPGGDDATLAPPREPETAKHGTETSGRPGLWLVIAIGGGGGYHTGSPEMNPRDTSTPPKDIHVSGIGFARLLHFAPEIGFFQRERLVLSAQGRFQVVSGTQDVHAGGKTYKPAVFALAGLAKVTWLLAAPHVRFQPFVAVQAGVGQIRHRITTPVSANLTGCGTGPTCEDTVLGGWGLAGAAAGFRHRTTRNLGLYAALGLLAGAPNFMVNVDLNLGLVWVQ